MKSFDAKAKHDMQEQRKGARVREPDKGMVQSAMYYSQKTEGRKRWVTKVKHRLKPASLQTPV